MRRESEHSMRAPVLMAQATRKQSPNASRHVALSRLATRNRKARFKSVSFRPDKELRISIGTPKMKQTRWEAHSQAHTLEEIEQLLSAFFAEYLFLTRRELQFLLNIKKSAACDLIKTLNEEGKLLNKGTHHQPTYVPAPGYFGKPLEG